MLLFITWDASPDIFSIGPITLRWYGMMFAVGFLLGFIMVRRMFLRDGAPEAWLDYCFYFLIAGTVLGARLGHILFYEWDYYAAHPADIIKVWKGGLASHGGVIGVVTALWLFSRYVSKQSFFWISDKVAAPIALVGAMIRFGNLMNSEIVGTPSDAPWAFRFVRALPAELAEVPRHPVQLYESLSYLASFALLFFLYWRTDLRKRPGFLTGLWFVLIFGFRFVWEFFKSQQGGFAAEGALQTGQWLSVPLVALGLALMGYAFSRAPQETAVQEVRG